MLLLQVSGVPDTYRAGREDTKQTDILLRRTGTTEHGSKGQRSELEPKG